MANMERAVRGKRIHFLDNLRTIIIFLVVVCHAGWVYESSGLGASFWIVDDPATNHVAGIVNAVLDIFMMPTLFFVAGYLAPLSLDSKGSWGFIVSKLKRLMVPWLIAVLTVVPLYKVIFLYSRGIPQQTWTSYFHWSNGGLSQLWLWFLPVLFLFDLLYVLLSSLKLAPARIPFKLAVVVAFLTSLVASYAIDAFHAQGWTKTVLLDFQNEKLLVYFLMFLLGTLGFRQQLFASRPKGKAPHIAVIAIAWIPVVVYAYLVVITLAIPDAVLISSAVDRLLLWPSFYLALLCILYVLIETARRYLDSSGGIWNELNRNSYYVYIIHVILVGAIALPLLGSPMPSLLKYIILTASSYLGSNLLVSLCRRATARKSAVGVAQATAR